MRRSPDTSTFRGEFTACNFLGYNICKSTRTFFLKVLFILSVAEYIQRIQRLDDHCIRRTRLLEDVKRCGIAFLSNKISVFLETSSYIQVVT